MTLEYFRDKICDELCGAEEYVRLGMEIRAMDASFSKQLVDMSSAELEHATKLYKMFEQFYQQVTRAYDIIPEHMVEIQKEVSKRYSNGYVLVKALHDAYSK